MSRPLEAHIAEPDRPSVPPLRTVMVVDDTPANLNLLNYILNQAHYEVRTMPSGRLAIASALDDPPDLILLDIRMPDIDGYEVCARLKAEPATLHIPVIFISALQEVDDKLRAFSAGGVDYITKPFQQAEVLARVDTHLRILDAQQQLEREVALRARAEHHAARQHRILAAIDHLRTQYIGEADEETLFDALLQEILDLTDSAFGLIGELRTNPDGQRYLQTLALSNIAWDDASRHLYAESHSREGLVFYNLDNLLGRALCERRPLLTNTPAEHPAAHGLPPGHPPLHAFAGIPLQFGDELLGLVALANRPGGYRQELVDELRPLLDANAQVLNGLRERQARRAAERRLSEREELLSELTENIHQLFWMSDLQGEQLLYVSPVVQGLFGLAPEACLAHPWLWHQGVAAEDRPALDRALDALRSQGHFDLEYRIVLPDGALRWIRERAFPVRNEHGRVQRVAGLAEDVSVLHHAQERIWYQATHDTLTDLHNRKQFHDHLQTQVAKARRSGERFALCYLDLDGFKQVNDTHGHAVGDLLLVEVARRLRALVRESDTLARLGGDEFAILMPTVTTPQGALGAAERIVAALIDTFTLGEVEVASACSVGIAFFPEHGADEEALLRSADQAMYRAKRGADTAFCIQPLG